MDSLQLNSQAEITNVYKIVIEDVIKNITDVFKDENISQSVIRDLETLWTTKVLKSREKTAAVTLVPMQIMVPFKSSPSSEITEIREIELKIPQEETADIDFSTVFSEDTMDTVVYLSNRVATTFLQQSLDAYLARKCQVDRLVIGNEAVGPGKSRNEDPLDDVTVISDDDSGQDLLYTGTVTLETKTYDAVDLNEDAVNEDPVIEDPVIEYPVIEDPVNEDSYEDAVPQLDGANNSDDADSSSDSQSSASQKSEEKLEQSSFATDGESLNSEDDVTDEDVETLFDCDNLILCQYVKVARSKNKWKFYFKDGVMNLNGTDYAFHKFYGDASW